MALGVGSQVAGYRIDALVGRGGGGVVYRATHRRLGRTDALKLLAPELVVDREFQRRFEREALMAAALDHPHIIPVYDAGEADGVLYLAMRLVEGPDLATMIEAADGGLDLKRTCTILGQVASALDAAHAKGLVHRDVKPENILIDHVADAGRAEHAYLSDFGLTRQLESTALSGTLVAGTLSYMAPERFSGLPSALAIDVYALGCVAYACISGSPPFNGSPESVIAGHLYAEPPRISDHRIDLPAGVHAILAKAIAKQPADRYPSCGAFIAALRDEIDVGAVASPTMWKPPESAARPHNTTWPPVSTTSASTTSVPTTSVPTTSVPIPAVPTPAVPTPVAPSAWTARRGKVVGVAAIAAVLTAALAALGVWTIGPAPAPDEPLATATRLIGTVSEVAIDPAGGVYLGVVGSDHRILKVEPTGTIRTIVGTGAKGDSGDNGPATDAQLRRPQGLALDGAGNLYVADTDNHRIRKIDPAGMITTIAGNGTEDSTGDGGPAALAQLQFPTDVVIDRRGTLYIAEAVGRRVRKIDQNGVISTVVGTGVRGFSGDGGPAIDAQLSNPLAIAVDDSGKLYIADAGNNRIRMVDAAGTITSIVGNGTKGSAGDGGPAAAAELSYPTGIEVDQAGSVYIADSSNDRIRKVDVGGRISSVAGSGIRGFSGDGGPAATAKLAFPAAVAVDRDGNVYVADGGSHRVRKIDQNGTITTVAGAGPSYPGDGGPATQALLSNPRLAYVDKAGVLYIADSRNHRIRRADPGGDITTIAGNGTAGYSGDGRLAIEAQLNNPHRLTADPAGNVYIADTDNHRVRKVTPDGKITTIAGIGGGSFSGDKGQATAADLRYPRGLALGDDGSLYIADGGNDVVRRVDPAGIITTVVGNGTRGFSGDGGPAVQAQLFSPSQVDIDRDGNLYIADQGNDRIRRVDRAGIITTVAGNGAEGFSGDGGLARDAQLNNVWAVAVDSAGNLYIADADNHRIRKVDSSGRITTIAGVGTAGSSGDRGPAAKAQLNAPVGVSLDATGALYVAESDGNRIRKIDAAGIITTVAGPPTDG
ncbi:MAG: protein kinase domain-containing protein [Pseudonocardiaceae bacterium]